MHNFDKMMHLKKMISGTLGGPGGLNLQLIYFLAGAKSAVHHSDV